MQKSLKWSPAQPIKKPDNIISSRAREQGTTGFIPSYMSEPTEDMRFIMSNEYMRLWFKERGKYEKDTYSKVQIIREESRIKRRYVQRMMTYKKPDKNEFIEQKLQERIKATKNDAAKNQQVDYSRYKYKPVCGRKKQSAIKADKNQPTGDNKATKKDPVNVPDESEKDPQAIVFCPVNVCVPYCAVHCTQHRG